MPIRAHEIRFRYPHAPLVLDGLSCTITQGAITAIVGPNGAGKSTLIRLLAGLRTPESGRVFLDDQELRTLSHRQRAGRIAFIEQRPRLAFDYAVRRVIEFGAHARSADHRRVDEAIEKFDLGTVVSTPYGNLSVGQQQRVSLARAWVQISPNPHGILLADEPCSAMDPKHTQATMNALRTLADSGIGIGIAIHDLTTAARWADHAIVLDAQGRSVCQGPADEAMTERVLSEVFELNIRRHKITGEHPILIPGDRSDH